MVRRVQQFQPSAEVLQSYAGSALVLSVIFREVAVADGADDPFPFLMNLQVDKRGFVVAHPMLESIFDQGDEKERRHLCLWRVSRYVGCQRHMFRQADTHQLHIVPNKVKLLLQQNHRLAAVVEHVAEQAAQVVHRLLRLLRAESNQAVDVIQCIKEKMRVQLALQVLQFRFGTAFLQLPARRFHLIPTSRHLDGDAQPLPQAGIAWRLP